MRISESIKHEEIGFDVDMNRGERTSAKSEGRIGELHAILRHSLFWYEFEVDNEEK